MKGSGLEAQVSRTTTARVIAAALAIVGALSNVNATKDEIERALVAVGGNK